MHIYWALCWNIVNSNIKRGFLYSKEGLEEDHLHGPMSQWGTIRSTTSTKEIVEGTHSAFQLFEVGSEVIQERFGAELPSSGITKGLHILQCLDGSPTLHAGFLERHIRTDLARARVDNTDPGKHINERFQIMSWRWGSVSGTIHVLDQHVDRHEGDSPLKLSWSELIDRSVSEKKQTVHLPGDTSLCSESSSKA